MSKFDFKTVTLERDMRKKQSFANYTTLKKSNQMVDKVPYSLKN